MERWLALSAVVLVLDQITKYLANGWLVLHEPVRILPVFNLTLMHNRGAAFSFLAGAGGWQRWLFAGLALGVSAVLIVWLTRLKQAQRLLAVALALIVGGALGNLIDRLWLGYVVDFLDFHFRGWHWPAFNIADAAITVGAGLLILDSLRSQEQARQS